MRTLIGTLLLPAFAQVLLAVPAVRAATPDFGGATLQRVGFGGGGGGGHRRDRTADSTPRKPEKATPKPPPETAEQHKAYLNRYGFGQ